MPTTSTTTTTTTTTTSSTTTTTEVANPYPPPMFEALVPAVSMTECERMVKGVIRWRELFALWYHWFVDSSGLLTDAAKALMCHCLGAAASLNGLKWELPCIEPIDEDHCTCADMVIVETVMGGEAGKVYNVGLYFSGWVEQVIVTGGTNQGDHFNVGGTPQGGGVVNEYTMVVSNPAQTYVLNRGDSGVTTTLGYSAVVPIAAGATVQLVANSGNSSQASNPGGVIVPGVTDPVQPYDGEFIRMDVLSVQEQ